MATTYICGDSFATEDPDYKEFYNLCEELYEAKNGFR